MAEKVAPKLQTNTMTEKLIIQGRLDGLNALIDANRRGPYAGARIKRKNDSKVKKAIEEQLPGVHFSDPVSITFKWYEPNARRDPDNIASGKKFIMDALVQTGVLEDDNQKHVAGFFDHIEIDRDNPRIECTITSEGEYT